MNVIFTAQKVIEGSIVVKDPIQILYCLHKIDLYLEGGMYMLSVSKEISMEHSDLVELLYPSEEVHIDKVKGT